MGEICRASFVKKYFGDDRNLDMSWKTLYIKMYKAKEFDQLGPQYQKDLSPPPPLQIS